MDIRIDVSQLVALGQRSQQAAAAVHHELETAMVRSTTQLQADARRNAPTVTHTLQRSIEAQVSQGGLVGQVGTNVPYARYVEEGRGPVVATRAKALRFVINGKVIFAKRVGPAKGRYYMKRAFEQNQGNIQREFDNAARRIVRTFGGR